MIACICGGTLEILMVLVATCGCTTLSCWLTNLYNRCQKKKCECACHHKK